MVSLGNPEAAAVWPAGGHMTMTDLCCSFLLSVPASLLPSAALCCSVTVTENGARHFSQKGCDCKQPGRGIVHIPMNSNPSAWIFWIFFAELQPHSSVDGAAHLMAAGWFVPRTPDTSLEPPKPSITGSTQHSPALCPPWPAHFGSTSDVFSILFDQ